LSAEDADEADTTAGPGASSSRLRWIARKGRDLVELERELFAAPGLTVRERLQLSARRYRAVLSGASAFRYLDRQLAYDNRFMPLLMPSYLHDIGRLAGCTDLPPASSLLDVGANVGQFAATFLWWFPAAKVWSFEPNASVLPLLRQNAAAADRWQVLPWGIGAEDGDATLWAVDGKSGQGSLFRANAVADLHATDARAQSVQIRKLNRERADELGIPQRVDVVKLDVEGAEESALRGLAELDWRYMTIELSRDRAGGIALERAVDLTEGYGAEGQRCCGVLIRWRQHRPRKRSWRCQPAAEIRA
jgi:FkbM family methyltransferase